MQQRRRTTGGTAGDSGTGSSLQPVDRRGAGGYHYRLHADGRVEIVRPRGSIFVTRESNPTAYDAIIAEVGPYPVPQVEESGSDTPFLDGVAAEQGTGGTDAASGAAEQGPVLRSGSGGYTYRLHADGRIDIVKRSGDITLTAESHPRAYAAIIAEVGPHPAARSSVEQRAPAPVQDAVEQAEPQDAQTEQAPPESSGGFFGWIREAFGGRSQGSGEGAGEAGKESGDTGQDVASGELDVHSMDRAQLATILASPETYGFSVWAAAHARDRMLEHQEAVDATGVGTIEGLQTENKTPGAEGEDCTTYILETLEAAFAAVGKASLWSQVMAQARRTSGRGGFKGIELMKALQNRAGWKSIFWAPDTQKSADDDAEHTFAASVARRRGTYYGVEVDKEKSVTNYRRTDPTAQADLSGIEKLKKVPVGVLAARGGMHMALLINGVVYEVHWDMAATERNVVEATPLENWAWLSGMITAPAADLDRAFGG